MGGTDLKLRGLRPLERRTELQHHDSHSSWCSGVGLTQRKHRHQLHSHLHLEQGKRRDLVLPVGQRSFGQGVCTMVCHKHDLQWRDLFN